MGRDQVINKNAKIQLTYTLLFLLLTPQALTKFIKKNAKKSFELPKKAKKEKDSEDKEEDEKEVKDEL